MSARSKGMTTVRFVCVLATAVLMSQMAVAVEQLELQSIKGWTIVVAEDAIPSEKYAAEEFAALFELATGRQLPVASEPAASSGNVLIGPGASKTLRPALPVDDLGDEGLRIRIAKDHIAIAGGRPRGTLYGVYEFFERYLDIRFLTHDHTHVPNLASGTAITCEEYSYKPVFEFRWSAYAESNQNPAFAARLRNNKTTGEARLGGVASQRLIGHSFARWMPAGTYGQEHPEYFAITDYMRALAVDGGGPELCVTNPEVIALIAGAMIAQLDGSPGTRHLILSQNDNLDYCRCERCDEINQREGTAMGSHLMFVNAVAERVARKHPDVKVGTLSYLIDYTRRCPKTVVPRDNVQIQLCSIEACTLHPLNDPGCTRNRLFARDLADWTRVCNEVWIWHYNTNYPAYDLPFPNLRAIGRSLRFLAESGARGVFMAANGTLAGEMSDLRNYLISRCLWNPSLDGWSLVEEFCRLHYREAGDTILEYLIMLHDNADQLQVHPACHPRAEQVGLNPEVARRAYDYFQRALDQTKDPAVRQRVEKASICAYRAMLETYGRLVLQDDRAVLDFPFDYADFVSRYIQLCHQFGMTMVSERGSAEAYHAKLLRYQGGFDAGRLENNVWRLSVLPSENAMLCKLLHKPSGRQLFSAYNRQWPVWGKLEEIGLSGAATPLEFDMEKDGGRLTLTAGLDDGSTMKRWIWLDAEDPGPVHFKTEIKHEGTSPKTYQFKVHPEFNAAIHTDRSDIVSAYVLDDRWVQFNADWVQDRGPQDHLLRSARGGGFAFFNHGLKFGAVLHYDPQTIEYPRLWWPTPYWWRDYRGQINLELITKSVRLEAGQSFSFSYQISYLSKPPG